jgi:hypothetical protein
VFESLKKGEIPSFDNHSFHATLWKKGGGWGFLLILIAAAAVNSISGHSFRDRFGVI